MRSDISLTEVECRAVRCGRVTGASRAVAKLVSSAATAPATIGDDDQTIASAFDSASQLTEGPGFHRGYWQRAYGEALPTPGSLVA